MVVAIGLAVYLHRRRDLRLAAWGTFVAILLGTVAIGYWTGFRDKEVDEDVVVATAQAEPADARCGAHRTMQRPPILRPAPSRRNPSSWRSECSPARTGTRGPGTATVVKQPDGKRILTFTEFDVDNGVDVDVYLTPGDGSDVSDRVELGDLKGNVGDQQYEIPADADLSTHSTVVLYCIPFSVRIAIAPLEV